MVPVAHITAVPVIEIRQNVASGHYRSGDVRTPWATTVPILRATGERIARALERYAAGEQDIVVDD